eukprot:1635200-Amphidinium_carterae.1
MFEKELMCSVLFLVFKKCKPFLGHDVANLRVSRLSGSHSLSCVSAGVGAADGSQAKSSPASCADA